MSILSKTWRGKWEMHTHLVFDNLFFNRLSQKFPFRSRETKLYEFSRTVSSILLSRNGLILEFILCIPNDLPFYLYSDIDIWVENISNTGVRELDLHNRTSCAYKIQSYLFSCSELTHLSLVTVCLHHPRNIKVSVI